MPAIGLALGFERVQPGSNPVRIPTLSIVLSLDRRRVVHFEVTSNPTQYWVAGQVTEDLPWDAAPRYLLRDRDKSYGPAFRHRVRAMGITEVITAPRSPWQNPYAERLIGSIRRECLDHVIIFNEHHLRRVLSSYFSIPSRHPNTSLARQGLPEAPSRPPSLDGQHHCLPGGWRSAPSLRTSSRLRESRYVPARTPSNCHHVIFEQVQVASVPDARPHESSLCVNFTNATRRLRPVHIRN